jgi:hypothetical protein
LAVEPRRRLSKCRIPHSKTPNGVAEVPLTESGCEHSAVSGRVVKRLLRQGDAKFFQQYSQMKVQTKRKALAKLNRQANESGPSFGTVWPSRMDRSELTAIW